MKKSAAFLIIVLIGLIVAGGVIFFMRDTNPPTNTVEQVNHSPDGNTAEENQNQDKQVQSIIVPKADLEGAVKDLKLAVGDVYGKFTIAKIIEKSSSAYVVEFDGEETLEGSLSYAAIGAVSFKVTTGEEIKLPQLFRDHYVEQKVIDFLLVRTPAHFTPNDFIFDGNGNSEPRAVRIGIKKLSMTIPPVHSFGSFDVGSFEFLD